MAESGLYCIENKINKKKYIGQSLNIYGRWNTHRFNLRNNKHANPYLQSAWNKYGESNFEFKILCKEKDIDNLNELESFIISELETFIDRTKGYNLTSGGDNKKMSEESVKKATLKRKENMNDEVRKRMSLAQIGKKASEETKKKLSMMRIGNKFSLGFKQSEETKEKKRLKMIDYTHSEETREKISKANTGKIRSEEAKEKMRLAHLINFWSKTVG